MLPQLPTLDKLAQLSLEVNAQLPCSGLLRTQAQHTDNIVLNDWRKHAQHSTTHSQTAQIKQDWPTEVLCLRLACAAFMHQQVSH